MAELGRLEPVPIQSQWPNESTHFTPWLSEPENLQVLADTIGIPLVLEGTEQAVGPYFADIVCVDGGAEGQERRIVIENQYGRSDHTHLGKLLTYLAGKDAYTAVWVAEEFSDEHRAAIEWLNQHSDANKAFWALEIQLWRIGNSPPAPRFNIVVAPNPVTKSERVRPAELSDQRRDRLEFWEGFREYLADTDAGLSVTKAVPETWVIHSVGKSGIHIGLIYSNYDLDQQVFVDDAVTRIELTLTGPEAFARYAALMERQSEISEALGDTSVVWYDRAAKERKVFTQRLWARDDGFNRESLYAWLVAELQAFRAAFLPELQRLSGGA